MLGGTASQHMRIRGTLIHMSERSAPGEEAQRVYEEVETRTARAMEALVGRDSFGELLARVTENAMALTRIGFDAFDLTIRNLRLAGRRDIVELGRQLARTEDKLESVLQEVERLRDDLRAGAGGKARGRASPDGGSAASKRSR